MFTNIANRAGQAALRNATLRAATPQSATTSSVVRATRNAICGFRTRCISVQNSSARLGAVSSQLARYMSGTAGTDENDATARRSDNTISNNEKGDEDDEGTRMQQKNAESSGNGSEASGNGNSAQTDQARITELEEQLKEMSGIRVRLLAEMENVRQIARRDVEQSRTFAISKFAKQMLDVADNLHRALDAVPHDELSKEENKMLQLLFQGVKATDTELRKIFASHEIEEFGAVGEAFDPNRHEAMFQTPHSDQPPGHIAQVLKTGYTFKDRVLRHAQVGTVQDS